MADEAHGEATPLLSLAVLSQAVQQYPCVPSPSQQPQGLHLWEVIRLHRKAGRRSKGHLIEDTWVTKLQPNDVSKVRKENCIYWKKHVSNFHPILFYCMLVFTKSCLKETVNKLGGLSFLKFIHFFTTL